MGEHGSTSAGPTPQRTIERTVERTVGCARSIIRDGVHIGLGASLLTVNRVQVRRRQARRWLDEADAAEIAQRVRAELGALDQRFRRIEDRGDHALALFGDGVAPAAASVVHHAREIAKDQTAQCRALLGRPS